MSQLLLSGICCVSTPNVHSDVWDCVEYYTIHMLLACRLKITFTFSLKLIISFLIQLQQLLSPSLIVTSSEVRVGTPLPLLSCCISGGVKKPTTWISSWLLKSITIPNSFIVSVPRMRSCCGLLFLSYSTTLVFKKVPFVIRVVKKVQLPLSLMLSLEDPIQSIPRLWNQPFWVGKQHWFVVCHKD